MAPIFLAIDGLCAFQQSLMFAPFLKRQVVSLCDVPQVLPDAYDAGRSVALACITSAAGTGLRQ
jgi:hypothetical protein